MVISAPEPPVCFCLAGEDVVVVTMGQGGLQQRQWKPARQLPLLVSTPWHHPLGCPDAHHFKAVPPAPGCREGGWTIKPGKNLEEDEPSWRVVAEAGPDTWNQTHVGHATM